MCFQKSKFQMEIFKIKSIEKNHLDDRYYNWIICKKVQMKCVCLNDFNKLKMINIWFVNLNRKMAKRR
jgi:hypothetical protein